ncbi:hypothetical protein HC762_00135 [bacterium]|nr:hypothetical protein [bacterium]
MGPLVGAAAQAISAYISGLVGHLLHVQSPTIESTASKDPLFECKTAEKEYRINDGGRVFKRSLAPHEYAVSSRDEPIVPLLVVE